MLMCRSCGEFVTATKDEESWIPKADECPDCGGTEFMDNDSGQTTDSEEV